MARSTKHAISVSIKQGKRKDVPPRSDGLEGVGLLDGCAVLCVVVDFDEKINFCFVNVVGSRMMI